MGNTSGKNAPLGPTGAQNELNKFAQYMQSFQMQNQIVRQDKKRHQANAKSVNLSKYGWSEHA